MDLSLVEKALWLKKTPLFSELDLDLLLPVCDQLELVHSTAGTTLFSKGDTDSLHLYLIVGGKISLQSNSSPITLEQGVIFGEESLLSGEKRAYTAQCLTDATLLQLAHNHLMTILIECPTVSLSLLQAYASMIKCRWEEK